MPAMLTEEDLSLRHLPEVSDYSFSFQIPTSSVSKGDDLLAGDNDFFEGADSSILATPAPASKRTNDLLTRDTPRPSILESSPALQQRRGHVASPSPSNSCATSEALFSPIIEGSISKKELGRAEVVEGTLEEYQIYCHQEEQQEQESRLPTSATSSTTLTDIPPPSHRFVKRSPLESHLEVRHSEPDLPGAEPQPQFDAAGIHATKRERQGAGMPKGSGIQPVENKSSRIIPKEAPRSTAITKAPKRLIVTGTMKSRNHEKSAEAVGARSKPKSPLHANPTNITLDGREKPTKPEDGLITGEASRSDVSLPSFALAGGVAGRLVVYSQELINRVKDTTEVTSWRTRNTEPNYQSARAKARAPAPLGQGIKMNLADRQIDPSRGNDMNDSDAGDQVDDRDKPLTLSQLSPRKQTMKLAMEPEDNTVSPSLPPTLPAPVPMCAREVASSKNKKRPRPIPSTSATCHDQRVRKKGKGLSNAINVEEGSGNVKTALSSTSALASDGSVSGLSCSSSGLSEEGSGNSGTVVHGSGVGLDQEGDKEEVNVGKIAFAKPESTLAVISQSVPMGSKVETKSGSVTHTKKVVGGRSGMGERKRLRRMSKSTSSVNGEKPLLRSRSVSVSVSAHSEVLRANERGKKIAQIRARREARERDKVDRLVERDTGADGDLGSKGMGEGSNLKRSGVTYTSSTRPTGFKFESDLRIQARKGDGERITRSASSMSSSNSGGRSRSRRPHPIRDNSEMMIDSTTGAGQIHRKENIRPVVPHPFKLATEERLKERRKFNEAVKEKEREREELGEQKRREREEEEEKEMRELRRKAVPKANAVPEWYKDAPKKTKAEGGGGV